ncbi:hypothetical protein BDF22DRAFT_698013 [Syncephalis plumigaleata]|nr:hypothetical protein BDF22DRAFT_698013 [Syncephalis plumigaleata]
MKFSAIIAIAVAVVALTSLVAVEASPVLDRRGPQEWNEFVSYTMIVMNEVLITTWHTINVCLCMLVGRNHL